MKKIKWRVQDKPTGRYRSFEHRGWPDAVDEEENLMATISCETEYRPSAVKEGAHEPLIVRIYDYSKGERKCHRLVNQFETLKKAKEAAEQLLEKHPEFFPKKKVDELYEGIKAFLDDVEDNAGIENFVEKVKATGNNNFLRSATISHLAYQFSPHNRGEVIDCLDKWIRENSK